MKIDKAKAEISNVISMLDAIDIPNKACQNIEDVI